MRINMDATDFLTGMASIRLYGPNSGYILTEIQKSKAGHALQMAMLKRRFAFRIGGQATSFALSLLALSASVYFGLAGANVTAIVCALSVWAPNLAAAALLRMSPELPAVGQPG